MRPWNLEVSYNTIPWSQTGHLVLPPCGAVLFAALGEPGSSESESVLSSPADSIAGAFEGALSRVWSGATRVEPSDPRAVAQDVVDDRWLTLEAWSRAVPEEVVDERWSSPNSALRESEGEHGSGFGAGG